MLYNRGESYHSATGGHYGRLSGISPPHPSPALAQETNNREIAFLRYDYTKDHINAASYKLVYRGQMECWQTLDSLYCLHNQENRPNGRKMRSLSVSDIIVTHEGGEAHAYYVEPIGYKQVDDLLPGLEQTKKRSVVREER